jgi:hypothetical protein
MLDFVSSAHNSKIMLGMLIKVLCGHAIATRRRLSREVSVTFEDLMRGASDLDVRSGTIETVTSLRDLWPITCSTTPLPGEWEGAELSGASTRAKKAINSVPYEPIPYASEQGIFMKISGQPLASRTTLRKTGGP